MINIAEARTSHALASGGICKALSAHATCMHFGLSASMIMLHALIVVRENNSV
jgi:hypothetical protein